MTNKTRNYTKELNTRYNSTRLRPGLKQVHIGDNVWLIGKHKYTNGYKNIHCVIYGPDRTEYHVYNEDVSNLWKNIDDENDIHRSVYRHGNMFIESKVKIYILTHILDNKENWVFDLSIIPNNGKLKVIYDNGTVKNIEFTGLFNHIVIEDKIWRTHKPIAYRLW